MLLDGICIDPTGIAFGKIRTSQRVSNLFFGGARSNRLFVTATKSLYAVFVGARGVQTP